MTLPDEMLKEMKLDEIRYIRNRLLNDADKWVNKAEDAGVDSTPYRHYRQQLRDVPQTYNESTGDVVWPTKPQLSQS